MSAERPCPWTFPLTPEAEVVRVLQTRLANSWLSDGPAPNTLAICRLLNTVFWASLLAEEGRPVRTCVAFQRDPCLEARAELVALATPVEFSAEAIAKLSAALPAGKGALGLSPMRKDQLCVSHLILADPGTSWVAQILGPGHIVVREHVSVHAVMLPDGRAPLIYTEGARVEDGWHDLCALTLSHTALGRVVLDFPKASGLLWTMCRAMVEHHRGGTVIFVPRDVEDWRASVEFTYTCSPSDEYIVRRLNDLRTWQKRWDAAQARKRAVGGQEEQILFYPASPAEDRAADAFRFVGGLSAIDGAVVMATDFRLFGYGAKLKPGQQPLVVREWLLDSRGPSEHVRHGTAGGTRHRSAAQFAADHPGAVALVASQDGRFTVFACDEGTREVLAVRAEWLLL